MPGSDLASAVVSLLEFWGMVEVGVGMIACCLPTLRPLFLGFSPESVLLNIRNAFSLRSDSSRGSSKVYRRAESKTSVATSDGQAPVYTGQHHPGYMESYAAGPAPASHAQSDTLSRAELDGVKVIRTVEVV